MSAGGGEWAILAPTSSDLLCSCGSTDFNFPSHSVETAEY